MKSAIAFLFTVLALVGAPGAPAQPAEKPRVIGYLAPGNPPATASSAIVVQGLRELGWIEGKNLRIEFRWGENKPERLALLAEELVRMNVDLILASSTPAVAAARNATSTIPLSWAPRPMPKAAGSSPASRAPAAISPASAR